MCDPIRGCSAIYTGEIMVGETSTDVSPVSTIRRVLCGLTWQPRDFPKDSSSSQKNLTSLCTTVEDISSM